MRKVIEDVDSGVDLQQSGIRFRRTALIILLVAVSAPISMEFGLVFYARWRSVLGRSTEVRTPVLDWIQANVAKFHDSVATVLATHLPRFSWQSGFVLPIIAAIIVTGMLLLKSAHGRHG